MAHSGTQAQQALWAKQAKASADYAQIPEAIEWGIFGMETNFGRFIDTSSAQATGLMQFIPGTARQWNYPQTNYPDASQSQAQFTAAALYLRQLFRGARSWDLAIRSYSGGGYNLADVESKAASHSPPSGPIGTPASGYSIIGTSANGITSVDDGIDMTLTEDAHAIGNGHVLWRDDTQWRPWGSFMALSLDDGPKRGWRYYVAEGFLPTVHTHDRVNVGQVVARRARNGGNGVFGNGEFGWAGFSDPSRTLAQERGHGGERPSPEGTDFAGFYRALDPLGVSAAPSSLVVNTGDLGSIFEQYEWSSDIDAALVGINREADTGYRYSQKARREILHITTFTTSGGR